MPAKKFLHKRLQMQAKDTKQPESAGMTHSAKLAELLTVGIFVGVFSLFASFLWKGYTYRAVDLIQHLNADLQTQRIPIPIVFIDIGEKTCSEWADSQYHGFCALLPRVPRGQLSRIVKRISDSSPKLLVIDIDLQSEATAGNTGVDPFSRSVEPTLGEKSLQDAVAAMKETPVLIAQPLAREPRSDQSYDYISMPTILTGLKRSNLLFGHVEQAVDADGVIRRFPASLPVANLSAEPSGRVPHLATQVCVLLRDQSICGRQGKDQVTSKPPAEGTFSFGSHDIGPDELIQFPYLIPRNIEQLGGRSIRRIEARALASESGKLPILEGSIVILGSSALGRKDYHVTPLNVFAGETPGFLIVGNEILSAILDVRLTTPSPLSLAAEKFVLIVLSTLLIFFLFWRPVLSKSPAVGSGGYLKSLLRQLALGLHFSVVIVVAVVLNSLLVTLVSFYAMRRGEVADPLTPVVAVVLDAVVALGATIGHYVAEWSDGRSVWFMAVFHEKPKAPD